LFSDPHTTHKNTVLAERIYSNQLSLEAQLVLHPLSTRNTSYLFPPQTALRK